MLTQKKEFKLNIASFDLIKGVMILTVVLHHICEIVAWNDWLLTAIIRALIDVGNGLMPAFAIISGYSFKEKDPSKLLKTTANGLCKPCIYVALVTAILAPLPWYLVRYHTWSETAGELISLILGSLLGLSGPDDTIRAGTYALVSCGPIWFLWALFWAQNVLNLILRFKKETWKRAVIVLACMTIGYWLGKLGFIFFSIPQGLFLVGFCYVGYLLKQYKLLQRWTGDIRAYLILLPIALAEMYWGYVNMWGMRFFNVVLDSIGATAMAVLFVMVGVWIGRFNWKATEGLKEVGIYSFWILAVHNVEMAAVPWVELGESLSLGLREYVLVMIVIRFSIIAAGVYAVKKFSKYIYTRRKGNGKTRIH